MKSILRAQKDFGLTGLERHPSSQTFSKTLD